MKKIAIVVVWSGKFPEYFPIWLRTVKYNPTIDWLLFTDDTSDYDYPSNVIVQTMSWEEIQKRVQSVFPFKITLDRPYKLCDYKCAYGEIFSKELKGYDFWGHCDLDMFWGDIRKFVTDEVLENYDVIGNHGYFILYRNCARVNEWYKTLDNKGTQDYRVVYQTVKSCAYDEVGGSTGGGMLTKIRNNGIPVHSCDEIRASLDIKRGNFVIAYDSEKALQKGIYFYWKKGKLFCKGKNGYSREYAFIHFLGNRKIIVGQTEKDFFYFNPSGHVENKKRKHLVGEIIVVYRYQVRWWKIKRKYWLENSTTMRLIRKYILGNR